MTLDFLAYHTRNIAMAITNKDMATLPGPRTSGALVIKMEYNICMSTATREMIKINIASAFRSNRSTHARRPSKTAMAKTTFIHNGLVSYNALSASGSVANASGVMNTSIKNDATPDRFHKSAIMAIVQNVVVGFVRFAVDMKLWF